VHVGCTGMIQRRNGPIIHQVVSSGILHPAPKAAAWIGIRMSSCVETEEIESGHVRVEMTQPLGTSSMFLRTRNYVTLKVSGNSSKLYVDWNCENGENPSIAIPSMGTL
jgi:hypothetical protein